MDAPLQRAETRPRHVTTRVHAALAAGASLLLCTLGGCAERLSPAAPNVVLLILDTLRADTLGSYGAPESPSPELDALANEGVLFERVFAPSSWTRPSTGSLLTGILPRSLGLYSERAEALALHFTTLAEVLHEAGYTTWGASANPSINSVFQFDQGFDEYRDSVAVFTSYMERRPGEESYAEKGLASARSIFRGAIEAVRGREGFPFYLQLNVMEAHEYAREGSALLTRPELRGLYPGHPRRQYLQAVRQLSIDVGDFVRELSALPGWSNTLFVIVSDHGEGLDSHPSILGSDLHGTLLYDSQVRVPWILYQPARGPRGLRVSRPVRLLDVMPTVLELAGVETPDGLDGRSLVALFDDPKAEIGLPPFAISETYFREPLDKQAVHTPEWSYLEHNDGHPGTSPRELQRAGASQDGSQTSELAIHFELGEELAAYLREWNRAHPKAPPTRPAALGDEERAQLEAIGYLEDDER